MSHTYATPSLLSNTMRSPRIAIIGAGMMGRAIAGGLIRSDPTGRGRITLLDRDVARGESVAAELGVAYVDDTASAVQGADVILICVKPKDVGEALQSLMDHNALTHHPLVVSIAAGVKIASIEQLIGGDTPVVRAMPNTASVIGCGMTVISPGTSADDTNVTIARDIFSTLGRCLVLDERHLDAVTALSASGPAFIYVVLEALADGGVQCGLPRDVAIELATQMMRGATEMVLATGSHPAALKDAVTTPGGCTIAGLLTLEDGRIRSVLARAIETTAAVASGLGR